MTSNDPIIAAGQKIVGPDGQGYEVLNDCFTHMPIVAIRLKSFGGAPEMQAGCIMPDFLKMAIRDPFRAKAQGIIV